MDFCHFIQAIQDEGYILCERLHAVLDCLETSAQVSYNVFDVKIVQARLWHERLPMGRI